MLSKRNLAGEVEEIDMIERFYLKDYYSFSEAELNLKSGLVVFTGPSGSGKSILMNSILSSLGSMACEASLCESAVNWSIDSESMGIENFEINVFKHIKKEKSRYFVNNQSLSKKAIASLSSNYLRHLSLKDYSDFENENLLSILDMIVEKKNKKIKDLKLKYKEIFTEHKNVKSELLKIQEEEKKIIELKEFASFEIQKIEAISPNIAEDEELLKIKKELSKKEKVQEKIAAANMIFDYEHQVSEALSIIDANSSFFDDSMNELRNIMDTAQEKFDALDDVNIEEVLNRIEELSGLKRRYGSIEEALAYKEQKIAQLKEYENIEITKDDLQERYDLLDRKINELADEISILRKANISLFLDDLNKYLKELYLRQANISIEENELNLSGKDKLFITLNGVELNKVSTGEFNRLRLAILAVKSEFMSKNGGVLMLDEIDANLSGEESMSVAKVLRQLSKHFQIFVISHQPQLTSMGDQHFLIYKDLNTSNVKELDFESRINEIARIISGDKVTNEAKKFAKELLEANLV